jgi:hypothetical protein
LDLDSFGGPVHVEWDRDAAMTLPFFIDFLKTSGLFDALVADCPLRYTSPNAPRKRDVLGNGDAVDACRPQTLRSHCGIARRWCSARTSRYEQDR